MMRTKTNYLYLQRRYGGKYVATYKGRVVASGNAGVVIKKVLKDRRASLIQIQFVERPDAACIYELSSSQKENRPR